MTTQRFDATPTPNEAMSLDEISTENVKEAWKDYEAKPEFKITENSVTVILPKINRVLNRKIDLYSDRLSKNESLIYDLLKNNGKMKRSEMEIKLGLKKSQTLELIKNLREYQLIIQVGRGIKTEYMITK